MDIAELIKTLSGGAGIAGLVITLLILKRAGILKLLIGNGKNGNNGNREMNEVYTQIRELEENHIHGLDGKLDKLLEINIKMSFILEDIRGKIK